MLDLGTLPKIDLHRHLGGSLRLASVLEAAREQGLPLPATTPEGLAPHVQVLEPMRDLATVLAAFDVFQRCFVSPAWVERLAFEAVEDAAREHVRLLELRFSPDFTARPHRLDWDALMESLLAGVARARRRYDLEVGLIAIASRGYGPESAQRTVDFALRWRHALVGFDLADDEVRYPPAAFAPAVQRVREAGLALTVHSGESVGPAHVYESLRVLGARRLGHGVAVAADPALAGEVRSRGVLLEMCPTSNERTRAVPSLDGHPARRLLQQGLRVALCSDDPGLFAIDLTHELHVARTVLGFTDAEIALAMRHALSGSFVDEATRARLATRHFAWIDQVLAA